MVVNIQYGQLSNRLVLLAHVLATAIVTRRNLLITVFEDLKDQYVCKQPKSICVRFSDSRFWAKEKRAYGVLRRILGNGMAEWITARLGIISFWLYRNMKAIGLAQDEVRAFFTPKPECISYAYEFARRYFNADQVRLGVHIRRGDYRTWKNGCYWYGDDVYHDVIQKFLEEIDGIKEYGEKTRVVVLFSDDPELNTGLFEDLGCVVLKSEGKAMDDHYLMTQCHFLVGPPSTFTLWASWYGRVPLCHIRNFAHRPVLAEFQWNEKC